MPRTSNLERSLLQEITQHHLSSHDFNGIPLSQLMQGREPGALEALKSLIRKRLADVVSGDWDNPHIIRMPSRNPTVQLAALGTGSSAMFCVYPTTKHMRRTVAPSLYRNRPFTRLLALAHPQLEPMFFELAVLDRYHSDPRYIFRFDGLDGSISIKDQHYKSRTMLKSDKVFVQSFGLGRNKRGQTVTVVFLRYLSGLTSRHQRHWESHLIRTECQAEGHYVRRGVYGEWTDGISVYDALLAELFHINKMCELIGSPPFFSRDFSDDRPPGFGLLMRTTRHAYLEFAHTLDKLISENLNIRFFEAEGLQLEEEITRRDGRVAVVQKGTLRLLEEWLSMRICFQVQDGPARIVAPLREIRKLRGKPAHTLVPDEYSRIYQGKKEKVIKDLYVSISNIRILFQSHPSTKDYEFPEHLNPENIVLY